MAPSSVGAVMVALAGLDLQVLSTARSRGLTWQTAITATGDKPLFGQGLNSFGEVQHLYYSEDAAEDQRIRRTVPDDPHSVPLAMLVNGGVVTFLGFLGVVGWVVVQASKVPSGSVAGAGLVGAVTAYLVQSLSGVDEVTLRFAFWVCLGGLAAFNAKELVRLDYRPVRSRVGATARAVGGALFVFFAAVVSLGWALRFVEIHRT
jgi:O-antigen ligase